MVLSAAAPSLQIITLRTPRNEAAPPLLQGMHKQSK